MADQRIKRGRVRVDTRADWRKILMIMHEDYEPLGVVQVGDSPAGALGRHKKTGEYVQMNAAGTKTLDRRKVEAALEAGRSVGRPLTSYEPLEPVMVRMGPTLKAFFERVGDGEVSVGVRRIGEEARQRVEAAESRSANKLVDIQTDEEGRVRGPKR